MSFLNARDKDLLREHLVAIGERVDRALRILNRGQGPEDPTELREAGG